MKENRNTQNRPDSRSSKQSSGTREYTGYNYDLFSDSYKQRLFGSVKVVLLCFLAALILLIAKSCFGPSGNIDADLLKGSFVYEENTVYEFDGKGKGCMCITDGGSRYHYEYTYTIKEDQIMLDFEAEEVRDATYTFKLNGDKLTIIGGEGTAGGKYTLIKSD